MKAMVDWMMRQMSAAASISDFAKQAIMNWLTVMMERDQERATQPQEGLSKMMYESQIKILQNTNDELNKALGRVCLEGYQSCNLWETVPDDLHTSEKESSLATALAWLSVISHLPCNIGKEHFIKAQDYLAGRVVWKGVREIRQEGEPLVLELDYPPTDSARGTREEFIPFPATGSTQPSLIRLKNNWTDDVMMGYIDFKAGPTQEVGLYRLQSWSYPRG